MKSLIGILAITTASSAFAGDQISYPRVTEYQVAENQVSFAMAFNRDANVFPGVGLATWSKQITCSTEDGVLTAEVKVARKSLYQNPSVETPDRVKRARLNLDRLCAEGRPEHLTINWQKIF